MNVIRASVVVVLMLLGTLVAFSLGGSIGRNVGRSAGKAFVRAVSQGSPPSLPTQWTPATVENLKSGMSSRVGDLPFLMTNADREAFTSCWIAKFTASVRGGPREMESIAQRSDGSLERISHQAGFECSQELSARVAAAGTWVPQFVPLYVLNCARNLGEVNRSWCECIAKEAQKYFPNPAAFIAADSANSVKELSASQRTRMVKLMRQCGSPIDSSPSTLR